MLAWLALSAVAGRAQAQNQDLGRFRALLQSGQIVQGTQGILTEASLVGQDLRGERIDVPRREVRALDVAGGTEALKWGAVGAGMGLVLVTAAILQVGADPYTTLDTGRATAMGVALPAAGAAVGALIGARITKWESVPIRAAPLPQAAPGGRVRFGGAVTFSRSVST